MAHKAREEEAVGDRHASARSRYPSMALILLVTLPYGIFNGGVTGTLLAFLLRREGVALDRMASELALLGLPSTLYFLWSPLVDFWMRRRAWMVASAAVAAGSTLAVFNGKGLASPLAVWLMFAATCAMMLNGAACGGLMASMVPHELKARASGVYQAGNMGGGALGGGGLILLSSHVGRTTLGVVSAIVVFLPALGSFWIDEPPVESVAGAGLRERLGAIGLEFKTTFLRWAALPSLLLLMSPLGSGGAIGLLTGVASDYGLSGNQTAWLNGIGGGLLTAAGALLVALVPPKVDIRLTYIVLGAANALAIGVLCVAPTRPMTYLVGSVLYQLTVGACWAVFTAVVLQVVGGAGKTCGSRYAIAVSLGSLPVAYMTAVDGLGAKWWGTRGLAGIDMAVSLVAAGGFLAWYLAKGAARAVVEAQNAAMDLQMPDTAV